MLIKLATKVNLNVVKESLLMALLPHSFPEGFVTELMKGLEDSSSKIWHKEELIMKESD